MRIAAQAALPRFVPQLRYRAPARPAVRPQPAATTRRDVFHRRAARLASLARPCALLVHGSGGDLLGDLRVPAALQQPFLDVHVLPFAFSGPTLLRHLILLAAAQREGDICGLLAVHPDYKLS